MSNFFNMNNYSLSGEPVFILSTVQTQAFKTLITALKEIIIETHIVFDNDGMKIVNIDPNKAVIVNLLLESKKFQGYTFRRDINRVIICVNLEHLHKIINSVEQGDTLTIYIEPNDYEDGNVRRLCIQNMNTSGSQHKLAKLNLLDLIYEKLEYPVTEFSSVINILPSDFSKIIRDCSNAGGSTVDIMSSKTEIQFITKGPYFDTVHTRSCLEASDDTKININQNSDTVTYGKFQIKHLLTFCKCAALGKSIELYLENNKPLIVKYDVADLGMLHLGLVPVMNE